MTTIKGNALNSDFTVCANGTISFTKIQDDVPLTAQTDINGYFEITFEEAGEYQADKIIMTETVVVS